jgi:hypothetical protein
LPDLVVLDLQDVRVRPDLQIAGRLALGQLCIEGGPFGADLAALEAEADLLAPRPPVARRRIDRHAACVALLVAELVGARLEHLEVVVARQPYDAVRAGDPHAVLSLVVVGLEVGEADRPVEQACTLDFAIDRPRLELVLLEAQAGAGPVHGRAADRLDDPGGQAGEVLGHPPRA